MSDVPEARYPTESGTSSGDKEQLANDPPAEPEEAAPTPAPATPSDNEDDFDIVFYPTIETPQDEQIISAPDSLGEDEITILLPAWSSTTVDEGRSVVPPPALPEPARRRSRWRGCFIGAIAALIVISLLGSSLFSVFWFWNMRNQRVAEVTAAFENMPGFPEVESGEERPPISNADDHPDRLPTLATVAAVNAEPVNRIVFVNENRQIETMAPDGDARRQLTEDARSYVFPSWSPDGSLIAAIGTSIRGSGIYILPDEETPAQDELYFSNNESPFYVYWSPDGQQISFLANDHAGLSLNIADVSGDSDNRIVASGSPLYWNWAQDSRHMLVHSGSGNGDTQLSLINDYGRPQAPLIPAPGRFQAPGISPSGHYWAYSQFQSGGTTWLVIDNRFTGETNSQRHAGAVALSWSPVRDELAFISGDMKDDYAYWGPLRLLDAETGETRLLSSETVVAFFWSPNGQKIATVSVPQSNNLGKQYEVRNDKGRRLARFAPDQVSRPAQFNLHAFVISVIDVESGEGLELAETGLSPVFLTQFLPYFDQYAFSHQIWSPDSNKLVLPIATGRQREITLLDVRNGRATPLAEGIIAFWSRQ